MKLTSLIRTLAATLLSAFIIAAPQPVWADTRVVITHAEQAPSQSIAPYSTYELVRIRVEPGSGQAVTGKIVVQLQGVPWVIDDLTVVAEDVTEKLVADKSGAVNVQRTVSEKIVGRADVSSEVYYGPGGDVMTTPAGDTRNVPVDLEDFIFTDGATTKYYVVYGHVGYNAWYFGNETLRATVTQLTVDEGSEVAWLYDAGNSGNYHVVATYYWIYPEVNMSAVRNITETIVTPKKSVVLGEVHVDSTEFVTTSDPEFELRGLHIDERLFNSLVDVRIVDQNGKMLPGTKPMKPEFKLANGHVKMVIKGLKLSFEEGLTSLKFVGRFGAYNMNNPPFVTMILQPQNWIWRDAAGHLVKANRSKEVPTVVCPVLRFQGNMRKGG